MRNVLTGPVMVTVPFLPPGTGAALTLMVKPAGAGAAASSPAKTGDPLTDRFSKPPMSRKSKVTAPGAKPSAVKSNSRLMLLVLMIWP